MTIARSVSHLSAEVKTQTSVFNEMDRISGELELIKQRLYQNDNGKGGGGARPTYDDRNNNYISREANPMKISKLTR